MEKQDHPQRYKVAAVQFEPTMFQKDENLRKLLELTEKAARRGAKLIVLPEMATTGYSWHSKDEIKPFVEEIFGPTTEGFAKLAKSYGCYIVVGLPEVESVSGSCFNTIAFIGPNGLLGKYRKTHLFVADSRWAREGDLDFPIFVTEIGVISGLICQDLMYFEPARILALKGVNIICCSSNWLRESHPSAIWAVRAFENGVYLIYANRWGEERGVRFHGNSSIINPDGSIQNLQVAGDGIVLGELDTVKSRSKSLTPEGEGDKILDRVPNKYHSLSLNPYLYNATRFFGSNNYRPLPEGRRSLIATISMRLMPITPKEKLQQIHNLITQAVTAAPAPLELIVIPELHMGIADTISVKQVYAQRIPGEWMATIEKLTIEHHLHIVLGIIEEDRGNYFDTVVLIGPQGYIGKYRKIHLSSYDRQWATQGDLGFSSFDTPLGRIGLLSGYDLLFPESARCLALSGADLICVPSITQSFNFKFGQLPFMKNSGIDGLNNFFRVRAGENNLYLAVAEYIENNSSDDAKLRAGIFGPNLWFIQECNKIRFEDDQIMVLSFIDTSSRHHYFQTNIVRNKELLIQRQTRWYNSLFNP